MQLLIDGVDPYGRADSSRTVWAVVNHNSEFAVTQINAVPEPGTWALAGVAVMMRRKRDRR